jgi:hypothetical protein
MKFQDYLKLAYIALIAAVVTTEPNHSIVLIIFGLYLFLVGWFSTNA